jgi:Zn-dependent protease
MWSTADRTLMSPAELSKILVSAGVLALAFTIAMRGGLTTFLFALLTVGIGFVGHELAHKFMAIRFGYWAAYQIWPLGLVIALVFSFVGFIFAALGAVQIFGRGMSRDEQGLISLSGPAFNIVLAVTFMLLGTVVGGFYGRMLGFGAQLNALIALFNCLPFSILDGRKILYWDKGMWALAVVVAGVVLLLSWS